MAITDIILNVGMEGSFELATPFTNAVQPNARYTVRSIRTLSDVIAAGENPQELYYTPREVPEEDYLQDLQTDICIIGLQSTAGEWIYVPQSYIETLPNVDGISYRPLALVAAVGMVRDDKDLANLLLAVNKVVLDQLGVQTQSTVVAVGAAELVSHTEDDRIRLEREARVTYSESEAAKAVRLERENAQLRIQLKTLNDYIKERL